MNVVHGLEKLNPPLKRSVLTVGNFDGVHRAHQQLLAQAGLFAANTGGPVVVLTFEPHPLTIVTPADAPPRLTTLQRKLDYLAEAGADLTVVAKSEPALLGLAATDFVENVIFRRFNPTHIVEGPFFGFGRGRRGTPELLRELAAGRGCEVHIVEPITLVVDPSETLLVSSTLIRGLLADGKVRRAALCLGRAYELTGRVVEGHGRGRDLGFPTANLAVDDQLVPGEGVFAGHACIDDRTHPAAISIGHNPTFEGTERRVEVHLLDFDGDLYGRSIAVGFDRRIRPQRTFDGADELAAQLKQDVAAVRQGVR